MDQPLDRRGLLLSIAALATAVCMITFVALPPFYAPSASLALNLAVVYAAFRSGERTGIACAKV